MQRISGAQPSRRISVQGPDDRVNTTKSLAQLRAAGKTGHPALIAGAYLGAVEYAIQIDDTVRTIAAGRVCVTPSYVTLKLTLERVIFVPREFANDPCLKSLSQVHEAKHADADAEALDGARPAFEAAVRAAIDRGTRNAGATSADALGVLTAKIQTAANGALNVMEATHKRLDDAIDNPADLERLKTACAGGAAQPPTDAVISQ